MPDKAPDWIVDGLVDGLVDALDDSLSPAEVWDRAYANMRGLISPQQAQAIAAQQYDPKMIHGMIGTIPMPSHPIEIIGTNPIALKAETAMKRLTQAIPFKVAQRITRVGLQKQDGTMFFTVVFESGSTINFHNVDTFPTDADIGRIVLECP